MGLRQPLDAALGRNGTHKRGGDAISVKPKIAFGDLLGARRDQKIDKKLKKCASGGFLKETSQKARVYRRFVATAILENDAPV